MKTKLLLIITLLPVLGNAATINVGRGFGNTGLIAEESVGMPLILGGYAIALGSFAVEPVFTGFDSIVSGLGDFREFATSTSPSTGPTTGRITGAFTGSGGASPGNFNNFPIYFVIGNEATLATSTALGVFRVSTQFPADVTAGGATAVTIANAASIIAVSGGGTASGSTFSLVAVPEPSTLLLSALGVLALLRRKR